MNDPNEFKTGNSCDPNTPASNCPFFLLKRRKIGAEFSDAHLIRVAPECRDIGGLLVCIVVLLAKVHTLKKDKGMHERKKMLGIRIPYLICIPRVESRHVVDLLGLLCR
jgi:hypothetical protein